MIKFQALPNKPCAYSIGVQYVDLRGTVRFVKEQTRAMCVLYVTQWEDTQRSCRFTVYRRCVGVCVGVSCANLQSSVYTDTHSVHALYRCCV